MKTDTLEPASRFTVLATLSALAAGILWFTGFSLAIASFNQSNAVRYSCWNHVISELGFPGASHRTWAFDATLAIASPALLPTLFLLGAHLRRRLGHIATGFGLIVGLAVSSIGLLGLRQDFLHGPYVFLRFFIIHVAFAVTWAIAWLVSVSLFTIIFVRRWKDPASRLMAIVGTICWVVYAVFVVVNIYPDPMHIGLLRDLQNPAFIATLESPTNASVLTPWLDSHRTPIWWPALMEWSLAGSLLLWYGAAVVFLWIKTRATMNIAETD